MNKVTEFYFKFLLLSWLNRNKKLLNIPNDKPRCFVFLAADYGNLGDVAITYAQEKFLEKHYPNHTVVDVPISLTLSAIGQVKKDIKADDIITVTGGGNMGDMYFDIELLRLLVVKSFPNNQVIVFPQTVDYSNTKEAKTLKRLAKKIYRAHPNLTLQAREKISFNTMQKEFPGVNVELAPDIVLSLDEREPKRERGGILFCLRDDKEKANNSELIGKLKAQFEVEGKEICEYDTHIGREGLSIEEREMELHKIWDAFRRSELVVTDRLHGMIFAYITGTPAIVLPNNNFKIKGVYEWVRESPLISFFESNHC